MLASVQRDWRPHTRTSRLRTPMRPLSSAGGPTSSPVAAKSDTSRSHLPSGMRIHADTVQVGARPIRAVVSVHLESFGNRPAYPDQSQRASASYVTMQTQSRIDAVAAPVLPMHTRSRPDLQRRPRFRRDRTAATQLRAQLVLDCSGLSGVPLPISFDPARPTRSFRFAA